LSKRLDAKHLTLAKNNTAQSFRNDLNGLKAQQISKLSGIFNTEAGSQKDWSLSKCPAANIFCAWSSQKSPILQMSVR